MRYPIPGVSDAEAQEHVDLMNHLALRINDACIQTASLIKLSGDVPSDAEEVIRMGVICSALMNNIVACLGIIDERAPSDIALAFRRKMANRLLGGEE